MKILPELRCLHTFSRGKGKTRLPPPEGVTGIRVMVSFSSQVKKMFPRSTFSCPKKIQIAIVYDAFSFEKSIFINICFHSVFDFDFGKNSHIFVCFEQ